MPLQHLHLQYVNYMP